MNAIADLRPPALDLSFEVRGGRTVLAQRHVTYPFFVTAPLRGRGPQAEIILQSISGGLFGGERLAQRVIVGDGAAAVIRMPSAAIVHDRRDKDAPAVAVSLQAGAGSSLHYLPRPVILLPGSGLVQSLDLSLGPNARVLVQDGFLLHDPHGIPAAIRTLDSRIGIRRAPGRLIALDRMRITDADIAAGPYRAFGTIWWLGPLPAEDYGRLKSVLSGIPANGLPCYWAMAPLRQDSGVMIRIAARDGGDLDIATAALREALLAGRS